MPRQGTIDELRDWELNGAVWRPVEVRSDHAVVDLCSCSGELMDRVEGTDPQFIAFVRERRDEWTRSRRGVGARR
jgi:hypothetical protein